MINFYGLMKVIFPQTKNIKDLIIIFTIGCLFNILLIVNPGYYSHDELSFGFHSQGFGDKALSDINWFSFLNLQAPQYRPITFNLWLFVSHFLFQYPPLFHLVVVLLGLLCGVALYALILQRSTNRRFALTALLIFSILPATAFTIGWVGTIGDFLWVLFTLSMISIAFKAEGWVKAKFRNPWKLAAAYLGIATLFVFALMSKETAIIVPGIFLLYILFIKRSKFVINSFLLISFLSVVYISLRFNALFGSSSSEAYSVTTNAILRNLVGYFTYPFAWNDFFTYPTQVASSYFIFSLLAHLAVIFLLWRASSRYAKVYVFSYIFTVAPLLLIHMWSPHYLFASSILLASAIAYILIQGKWIDKALAALLTLVLMIHSFNVQLEYYNRGLIQNRILTSLYVQIKDYMKFMGTDYVPNVYIRAESDSPAIDILQRAIHSDVDNIKDLNIKNRIVIGGPPINSESHLVLQYGEGGYLTEESWPTSYILGDKISFLPEGNGNAYMVKGWSQPEPGGTWTDGEEAEIILNLAQPVVNDLILVAKFFPFVNDLHPELSVDVLVNEETIATWVIAFKPDIADQGIAPIPVSLLEDASLLTIKFRIHEPISPAALGLNSDTRKLGLYFSSLTIAEETTDFAQ